MKKMKMCFPREKRFVDGFEEYILDCKARNLWEGTINHYRESIKQIYKRISPDTPISSLNQRTMKDFYIALRDDPNLNEVSMGTYARDLKTLMRFFMKCGYIPHFEIQLPKADKAPIQTYTDDELKKLLKKPDVRKCIFSTYRSWVIVNFLLSTGVRQNSLVNIKIRDVDFDNSVVYVNTTKNRKPLIMINWKNKLTSRKFWMAVVAFITPLLLSFGLSESTVTQIVAIIMAGADVLAYIIAEGMVDAAGKDAVQITGLPVETLGDQIFK